MKAPLPQDTPGDPPIQLEGPWKGTFEQKFRRWLEAIARFYQSARDTGLALLAADTAEDAKTTLGLENVDNTADADKPISTATQDALDAVEAGAEPADPTLTALAAYNTNGFLVQTAADTFVGRSFANGTGITWTNPAGTAGNPAAAVDTATAFSWTNGHTWTLPLASTALIVVLSDDGAGVGPSVLLDRISASPAASDLLGTINFRGRDSGGNVAVYARVRASIADPTNLSEDGVIQFATLNAAGDATRWSMGAGLFYSTGADMGANTVNLTALYASGIKVVGSRDTGWTAMTGSGSKGALAAAAAGTANAAYVQAELQGALNRIAALEARLKSYDDALFTHGLIGA